MKSPNDIKRPNGPGLSLGKFYRSRELPRGSVRPTIESPMEWNRARGRAYGHLVGTKLGRSMGRALLNRLMGYLK